MCKAFVIVENEMKSEECVQSFCCKAFVIVENEECVQSFCFVIVQSFCYCGE